MHRMPSANCGDLFSPTSQHRGSELAGATGGSPETRRCLLHHYMPSDSVSVFVIVPFHKSPLYDRPVNETPKGAPARQRGSEPWTCPGVCQYVDPSHTHTLQEELLQQAGQAAARDGVPGRGAVVGVCDDSCLRQRLHNARGQRHRLLYQCMSVLAAATAIAFTCIWVHSASFLLHDAMREYALIFGFVAVAAALLRIWGLLQEPTEAMVVCCSGVGVQTAMKHGHGLWTSLRSPFSLVSALSTGPSSPSVNPGDGFYTGDVLTDTLLFTPATSIDAIVINEGVSGYRVLYYLALLVRSTCRSSSSSGGGGGGGSGSGGSILPDARIHRLRLLFADADCEAAAGDTANDGSGDVGRGVGDAGASSGSPGMWPQLSLLVVVRRQLRWLLGA